MKALTMKISPALAAEWLTKNTNNRRIDVRHVARLAAQLTAGNWEENGQTIAFSEQDVLLDGQHRLAAIVKSGIEMSALVVFGLKDKVFSTINTGMKPRSAAAILQHQGFANASTVASAARWVFILSHGGNSAISVHANEVKAMALQHPLLEFYGSKHASTKGLKNLMPACAMGIAVLVAEKYGQNQADSFLDSFAEGTNLSRGQPVYELRERFMSFRGKTARLHQEAKIALTIKAMKAYVEGRSIGILRWSADEGMPSL